MNNTQQFLLLNANKKVLILQSSFFIRLVDPVFIFRLSTKKVRGLSQQILVIEIQHEQNLIKILK